ncbi:hypothetical protein SAMN05421678_12727 [Actinopolymorpha cephalotaxi]|uniref:Uncharacterized protein n=1 Tax=Actinopolymorpha cephalotaxi TaxID=504797 RepID=A0A1I3BVS6_9ACTN|nr:hypothetical protein [Actinopolymorpha cephalotaxi]SFH66424.1 hypothetical protein SAMN05421678_12727 [Actinopolymorpha cephalotaxi]
MPNPHAPSRRTKPLDAAVASQKQPRHSHRDRERWSRYEAKAHKRDQATRSKPDRRLA